MDKIKHIKCTTYVLGSRGSSVSIVTGLQAGRSVFDFWHGQWWDLLSFCPRVQAGFGTHPASYINGYQGPLPKG